MRDDLLALSNIRMFPDVAMSQAQTGHKVEAREGLQRALDSGLGEPDAAEAKRVLAELNRPTQ